MHLARLMLLCNYGGAGVRAFVKLVGSLLVGVLLQGRAANRLAALLCVARCMTAAKLSVDSVQSLLSSPRHYLCLPRQPFSTKLQQNVMAGVA